MTPDELLQFLRSRRSVRAFADRAVPDAVLTRIVQAATSAPSAANRQPWRFALVTAPGLRRAITEAVRARCAIVRAQLARSPHAPELEGYWGFLHQPLQRAPALIVPQYRPAPDLLRQMLASVGEDASALPRAEELGVELCATSAALMALLLQAHVEGLGACWMTGPLLAREEIAAILGLVAPWRILAVVPVGYPAASPPATPRRPLEQVIEWYAADPAGATE